MEAKQAQLEKKLADLLRQAADVASEIQAVEQGIRTPHYDQIELPAHEVGQQLSRMIQTTRMRDVAAENLESVACPDCGCRCPVEAKDRTVHSMDGPIELTENVAYCRRCRRSFFPSA
jgi:hypothetical protein